MLLAEEKQIAKLTKEKSEMAGQMQVLQAKMKSMEIELKEAKAKAADAYWIGEHPTRLVRMVCILENTVCLNKQQLLARDHSRTQRERDSRSYTTRTVRTTRSA